MTSNDDSATALTRLLVGRAMSLKREALPEDVVTIARQCLLDFLAVTLAGHSEPLPQFMLADLEGEGGRGSATIIGSSHQLKPREAALVNGCAAHALDFDDVNLFISGHPSAVIFPSLLALGEELDASGADLMLAFVAAYEFTCRVGVLVEPGHYLRGYHATSTVGVLGAAVACARLLGLDEAQTRDAVGIAATQAAGLKCMFGTPCKPLHAGLAARNGLEAARWAGHGLTSRSDALECAQGFALTLSPDFRTREALAEPQRFYLRDNLFKYHAACYGTHSAIEAAASLRLEHRLSVADLKSVVVRVEKGANATCNIVAPHTAAEAKFSLRFAAALAMLGLDTADLLNYGERTLRLPEVANLGDMTSVELMEGWTLMETEIEVTCRDGRRLRRRFDSGQPATDVQAQGSRLAAKFATLTDPVLGHEGGQRLARAVEAIEVTRVRELMGHCRSTIPATL